MKQLSGIDAFNYYKGRLRISVTNRCQLTCLFCHREGILDHWQNIQIPIDFFSRLIFEANKLNIREINLTGGEPILHSNISDLIDIAYNPNRKLAICTNGLELDKIFNKLDKIQQIKLSVHATNNTLGKNLLGENFDFDILQKNIKECVTIGSNITINHTLTKKNEACLEELIDYVYNWKTDLLICDLMETQWSNNKKIGYIDSNNVEKIFSKYAVFDKTVQDSTGCIMKEYKSKNNKLWRIKSSSYPKLQTKMCQDCQLKVECGEGVFVLRVDARGVLKPCLLRRDLYKQIPLGETDLNQPMTDMIDFMFPSFPITYYESC